MTHYIVQIMCQWDVKLYKLAQCFDTVGIQHVETALTIAIGFFGDSWKIWPNLSTDNWPVKQR